MSHLNNVLLSILMIGSIAITGFLVLVFIAWLIAKGIRRIRMATPASLSNGDLSGFERWRKVKKVRDFQKSKEF